MMSNPDRFRSLHDAADALGEVLPVLGVAYMGRDLPVGVEYALRDLETRALLLEKLISRTLEKESSDEGY